MIRPSLFSSGESSGYKLRSWMHLSAMVPCILAGRILSYSYIPHLVVVLVEHDNNLGHVVQLWDSTQIVHGSLPLLVFVFLIYTHKQSHGISNSRHLAAFSEMGLSEFVSPQDNNIVRTKNTLLNLHEERRPSNASGVLRVRSNCIEGRYSYPYNPHADLSTSSCKPPTSCWLKKSITHNRFPNTVILIQWPTEWSILTKSQKNHQGWTCAKKGTKWSCFYTMLNEVYRATLDPWAPQGRAAHPSLLPNTAREWPYLKCHSRCCGASHHLDRHETNPTGTNESRCSLISLCWQHSILRHSSWGIK